MSAALHVLPPGEESTPLVTAMGFRMLADATVVLHLAFVAFVLLGGLLVPFDALAYRSLGEAEAARQSEGYPQRLILSRAEARRLPPVVGRADVVAFVSAADCAVRRRA